MSGWHVWVSAGLVAITAGAYVFVRWSRCWGASADERTASMPGDAWFVERARAFVAMTRAVSIDAAPELVWPWLAQLGRGAGWYSVDRLDNGGIESARHIISWVPPPQLGDASAVGYLRHIDPGRALTWWTPGLGFLGAFARLVVDLRLQEEGPGSRLIIRMSADAAGATARPALFVFQLIDGIMAIRQLKGIRDRAERRGARTDDPQRPETGTRTQFQRYEVVFASGERAGSPGEEQAERWRRAAMRDGVLDA